MSPMEKELAARIQNGIEATRAARAEVQKIISARATCKQQVENFNGSWQSLNEKRPGHWHDPDAVNTTNRPEGQPIANPSEHTRTHQTSSIRSRARRCR